MESLLLLLLLDSWIETVMNGTNQRAELADVTSDVNLDITVGDTRVSLRGLES